MSIALAIQTHANLTFATVDPKKNAMGGPIRAHLDNANVVHLVNVYL